MMNKRFAFSLGALFLVGCATTPSREAANLVVTTPDLVQGCESKGEFSAGSLLSMVSESMGVESARVEVMERAQRVGATHIVWGDGSNPLGGAPGAKARAYRCLRFQYPHFSFPAPGGEWKRMSGSDTAESFCRGVDGQPAPSSVCFMVATGTVNAGADWAKNAKQILNEIKKAKKADMDPARFQEVMSVYKTEKFKGMECLKFEMVAQDKLISQSAGTPYFQAMQGRNCLVPGPDALKWVDVSLSIRYGGATGEGKFLADDLGLLDGVEFKPSSGSRSAR